LPGHASLKTVRISFEQWRVDDADYAHRLETLLSVLVESWAAIKQTKLLCFSVESCDLLRNGQIISSSFQDFWDKNMVPILALNWHRSELAQRKALLRQQPKRQRLLSELTPHLALRLVDVNLGNIYRLVTASHSQCDMATANATMIYQLLQETDVFMTI
jgi:hypothetical protein